MKCLECQSRTEVLETNQRPIGTRRRRQCLECGYRFTTNEIPAEEWFELTGHATRPKVDLDVLDAVRALDRRKREIAERQARKRREAAQDDDYDDYEHAPDHLDYRQLKEELG